MVASLGPKRSLPVGFARKTLASGVPAFSKIGVIEMQRKGSTKTLESAVRDFILDPQIGEIFLRRIRTNRHYCDGLDRGQRRTLVLEV